MLEVEVGLGEFQLDQHRRAVRAGDEDEDDAGVQEAAGRGGEGAFGDGELLGRRLRTG